MYTKTSLALDSKEMTKRHASSIHHYCRHFCVYALPDLQICTIRKWLSSIYELTQWQKSEEWDMICIWSKHKQQNLQIVQCEGTMCTKFAESHMFLFNKTATVCSMNCYSVP